jgi:hypothetical protein
MIPINKMKTPFRVAFKVVSKLNLNKVTPKFTLHKIDLGDPCVSDSVDDNLCMGHGKCTRNGPVNNYTCKCDDGYRDKNCQFIDFCNFKNIVSLVSQFVKEIKNFYL